MNTFSEGALSHYYPGRLTFTQFYSDAFLDFATFNYENKKLDANLKLVLKTFIRDQYNICL